MPANPATLLRLVYPGDSMKADTPVDARNDIVSQDATDPIESALPEKFAPGDMVADRYRVEKIIGQGGMGIVYSAEHIFLKRRYALKTLSSIGSGSAWIRFQREARAISKLEHENIVRIHDFGLLAQERPFFAMDLLDGGTLGDMLRKTGPLDLDLAYGIFQQICTGLAYAHGQGVVHRDVKPGNIALTPSEPSGKLTAKILDFGIAKQLGEETQTLTRTGELFGTPLYMSPEQCRGLNADHRCDIYAVGCMFFEALTGTPPFASENALSTMMMHISDQPPSLKEASLGREFPGPLESIIRRMLEKYPQERYQSLHEVANDLRAVESGSELSLAPKTDKNDSAKQRRFKPLSTATMVIGLLVLSAVLLVHTYALLKSQNESLPHNYVSIGPVMIPKRQATETKFYSTTGTGTLREFHFPDTPIGSIAATGIRKHEASGVTQLDLRRHLCFYPNAAFCANPANFARFRPDEIYSLRIDDDSNAVDGTLAFLLPLKNLQSLRIADTDITDDGLRFIEGLHHIYELDVSRSKITGRGLANFKNIGTLQVLTISSNALVQDLLHNLKRAKKLIYLSVTNEDLQDSDVQRIAEVSSLEGLRLNGNLKITDAGVSELRRLSKLKNLQILGCRVTPKCIESLKELKQLELLKISTIGWTREQELHLQSVLPRCRISGLSSDFERTLKIESLSDGL